MRTLLPRFLSALRPPSHSACQSWALAQTRPPAQTRPSAQIRLPAPVVAPSRAPARPIESILADQLRDPDDAVAASAWTLIQAEFQKSTNKEMQLNALNTGSGWLRSALASPALSDRRRSVSGRRPWSARVE